MSHSYVACDRMQNNILLLITVGRLHSVKFSWSVLLFTHTSVDCTQKLLHVKSLTRVVGASQPASFVASASSGVCIIPFL